MIVLLLFIKANDASSKIYSGSNERKGGSSNREKKTVCSQRTKRSNTPIKSQWKKGIKYQCHSQNRSSTPTQKNLRKTNAHNNNDRV